MEIPKAGDSFGDYIIVEKAGFGAFSNVYTAIHSKTGIKVALKVIQKKSLDFQLQKDTVNNEIKIYKNVDFPLICEYYESFITNEHLVIVLEYVEGGTLLSYLNNIGILPEYEARHFFVQLLYTLDYLLMKCRVIHRDIKLENVLIDRNKNIRLIDFGLSYNTLTKETSTNGPCGSPAYAAPEVLMNKSITQRSDIWSCGVLLFALTNGRLPFEDDDSQRLMQKIRFTEPRYSGISSELKDLLQKMLKKDCNQRISLLSIFDHPWIIKYKGMNEMKTLSRYSMLPISESIVDKINSTISMSELENEIKNCTCQKSAVEYRILKRKEITDKMSSFAKYNQEDKVDKTKITHCSLNKTQTLRKSLTKPKSKEKMKNSLSKTQPIKPLKMIKKL